MDSRQLHQVPALIVGCLAAIGQQIGNGFRGIHGGATAESNDRGRHVTKLSANLVRYDIYSVGGWLIGRINETNDVSRSSS